MYMRKSIFIVVALLVVMAFVGVAFAEDKEVRVGVYHPLTGPMAGGGQISLKGIKLAHKLVPEVLGLPVKLFVEDTKSEKVEAANAASRLINKYKVHVIIGCYGSSLSMAGGEVIEKAGIPAVADGATNPLVTQGKKWYFRNCFTDPYQGKAAAKFAINNLKAKKAALLVDVAQDYSVGLANFFKKNFEKYGGKIVAFLKYQTGDQDFTAQLTEIINKKPDILYIPGYFGDAALIAKQARELGGKFIIMGGDALNHPKLIEIGGKAVEGLYLTAFAYAPDMPNMTPLQKKFTELYRKEYGEDPNAQSALSYDTYMLVIDAIKRAGSLKPEAIAKALAETKNLEQVTGTTTMNETHDALKPVGVLMVKDGKFKYVETVPIID